MDKRFFYLLNKARHRVYKHADQRSEEALGISVTQVGALLLVAGDEGCLLKDLAHSLHLNSSALTGLAGRMATFGASARRLGDLPDYDHTDPQLSFQALADPLRSLVLSLRHVEPKSRALRVSRHSENIWTVRIDNPEIIASSRIVLRVGGDISEKLLRKIFVDQATVGAADAFDSLWKSRLTGS